MHVTEQNPTPTPTPTPTDPPAPRPVIVQPAQPTEFTRSVQETLASMGNTLASLPEQIVNAVREATPAPTPAPTPTPTPAPTPTPTPAPTSTEDAPRKRRSVGDWWFGK